MFLFFSQKNKETNDRNASELLTLQQQCGRLKDENEESNKVNLICNVLILKKYPLVGKCYVI